MTVTIERLRADIEANPDAAIAGLTAFDGALNTVTRDRTAEVDVDTAGAIPDLFALTGALDVATRDRTVDINVDQDGSFRGALTGITTGLNQVQDAATGAVGALGGGGGSSGGGGGFSGVMSGASRGGAMFAGTLVGLGQGFAGLIPMVIAFMAVGSVLPGLLQAAAAGAGILVGALAPLVGLLGMLVPAIGAFVVVIGTLMAALGPIIQGVSAYGSAMDDAGASAEDLAAKQHALAMAMQELRDAQEALAKAPHEAREHLEDLHFAAAQAALSERAAILALKEAQENLNRIQEDAADSMYRITQQTDEFTGKVYDVAYASEDSTDSAYDEERARLALAQAELDVQKAKDATQDAQLALAEAERKGIKNSDIMVQARRRLAAAEYAVAQARKALTKATTQGSAAMQQWADAMKNLSPEAIEFVKFLHDDFMPALSDIAKAAQDGLVPGLRSGLEDLMGAFDEIAAEAQAVGKIIGDAFADFMEFWTEAAQQDLLTEMFRELNKVIEAGLGVLRPFSRVLVSIIDSASPILTDMLDSLADGLDRLADWMETDNGKKKTTEFFEDAWKFTKLWGGVLKGIGGILKAITRAAEPFAEDFLEGWGGSLQEMSDYLNSPEGQTALKDYFEKAIPTLEMLFGLIGDVFDLLFNSSQGGEESGAYKFLEALRYDLLPELKDLFEELDDTDWSGLVIALTGLVKTLEGMDWEEIADNLATIAGLIDGIGTGVELIGGQFGEWEIPTTSLGVFRSTLEAIRTGEMPLFMQKAYNLGQSIGEDINNLFNLVLWPAFEDTINNILGKFGTDWDTLIETLKEAWTEFTEWLSENMPDMPDLTPWDGAVPFVGGDDEEKGAVKGPGSSGIGGDYGDYLPPERSASAGTTSSKQDITMVFNEKVDPLHVASELAWRIA